MFEDGAALVNMNDVKDITLDQVGGGDWCVFVHRRFDGKGGDQYTELYRSHDKSDAKEHFHSLTKHFPNLIRIG